MILRPAASYGTQQTLLGRLGGWRILNDHELDSAVENVARDARLGEAVARGDSPPLCRLWKNHQALVVSRRETRLPSFEQAAKIMTEDGWPVVLRDTGGSAVPHAPGTLQFSLLMPRSALTGFSTDAVYQLLVDPLQRALAGFGVSTQLGHVAEAFCDGRFNLHVAGKKIAGTAQVWRANVAQRAGNREGYVLAHASMLVYMDRQAGTDAVNRFYTLAGDSRHYRANALTTVSESLDARCTLIDNQLGEALISSLRCRIIETLQSYLCVDSVM